MIRRYKINIYYAIYVSLSILNIFLYYKKGISYLVYPMAFMLIIYKMIKILNNEEYLLYSLFIPNKYLQLLSVLLFLAFENKLISKKLRKKEIIFIIYIFTIGLVNCCIYDGIIIAVLFQTGFYYCILRSLDTFNMKFSENTILSVFDKMFFLQIITVIIEYLITHETADALTGTMISAHYLGVFLCIYAYVLFKNIARIKNYMFIIKIVLMLLVLYFSDAKHVIAIFVFAAILSKLYSVFRVKRKLLCTMIFMTLLICISLVLIEKGVLSLNSNLFVTYVMNSQYNKKIQLYTSTFKKMIGINGLFGYGVGLFGSQICLTLAKGIIYSWDSSLSNYIFAISPYEQVVDGLMTEWYTIYGIPNSSMVLSYPFVSYIPLVAELGLFGLVMFMNILDRNLKDCKCIFVIAFLLLTNFDTYFEIPCVFILILIAENISKRKPIRRPNIVSMEGK